MARARVRSAEQLIDVAKADIQVVQAQISDVALRLARTEVKAPVAGTISAKTAKIGAIASGNGDPLFTLIRDGAVEMRADVTEADLLKIAVGQTVALKLADSQDTLSGRVRLISPLVDNQTRLGTVYLSIDKAERARVGMYATADIIVAEKDGLTLPLTAVTSGREGTTVRKVEKRGCAHGQGRNRHSGRPQRRDPFGAEGRRGPWWPRPAPMFATVIASSLSRARPNPRRRPIEERESHEFLRLVDPQSDCAHSPLHASDGARLSVVQFAAHHPLSQYRRADRGDQRRPERRGPAELETQVTKEIEDAVAGVTGVKHVTSTITDGLSTTAVEFEISVPTEQAVQDTKDANDRIRGDLPASIEEPIVSKIDVEGQAIQTFAVSSPGMTLEELSWFRRRYGQARAAGPDRHRPHSIATAGPTARFASNSMRSV